MQQTAQLERKSQAQLRALLGQLERWLPREEARLTRAREGGRPQPHLEAEWRELLGLYERLCRVLGPHEGLGRSRQRGAA